MAVATPVRTYQGQDIPEPGTYALDTSHSAVEFVGRHLGFSKVRGHFSNFEGRFEIAEVPEESSVAVEIDVASVDSSDQRRDEHLRSADFFDAENHPKITFKSTGVRPGKGDWEVTGDLTVRGTT